MAKGFGLPESAWAANFAEKLAPVGVLVNIDGKISSKVTMGDSVSPSVVRHPDQLYLTDPDNVGRDMVAPAAANAIHGDTAPASQNGRCSADCGRVQAPYAIVLP